MAWYAAHIVMGVKVVDPTDVPISVYENVVIIEAETHQIALTIAKTMGESEANSSDGFELDGKPATKIFAGVRKIATVNNPELSDSGEAQPAVKEKLAYSDLEIKDIDELLRLAQSEAIHVVFVE